MSKPIRIEPVPDHYLKPLRAHHGGRTFFCAPMPQNTDGWMIIADDAAYDEELRRTSKLRALLVAELNAYVAKGVGSGGTGV